MSQFVMVGIDCDRCHREYDDVAPTAKKARANARADGWHRRLYPQQRPAKNVRKDYCPECWEVVRQTEPHPVYGPSERMEER